MLADLLNSEEKVIQKYIEDHDYILSASVGEISWAYNFVLPHIHLGDGKIPDFIVVNGQSDSYWIYMVDLKLPNEKRFNKNGSFCNKLNQAVTQVRGYEYYGNQHTDELRDILCKEIINRYGDQLDSSDKQSLESYNFFNKTRRFIVQGYIIIGRRNDLTETAAWQTSNLKDSGISIISYDRLVEAENRFVEMVKNNIPKLLYSTDDSIIREQYHYDMKNKTPEYEKIGDFSADIRKEDKIEALRAILNTISSDLLLQDKSIIVADEGEEFIWFIEVLSLMAKQVNLCGACLTLLKSDMEQEAYLMVRSQFNNMLWIKYLLNDIDGTHLKEFIAQPYISQIFTNKKLKETLDHLEESFKEKLGESLGKPPVEALDESISRYETELNNMGIRDKKPKSILKLAEESSELFDMYITLYNEGSKFEHSDISTTKMYRKSILPQYDNSHVFSFSLNTHDAEMWERVFNYSNMCLFFSYDAIRKRILDKERHLIDGVGNIKGAYDENTLKMIDVMFAKLQMM